MRRAIIADDNPDVRARMSSFVSAESGAYVETVKGGDLLLSRLADAYEGRAGRYHLALTDVNMPGMGGFEAVPEIREFDKRTPIYVMSAAAAPSAIAHCRTEAVYRGANGYFAKDDVAALRRIARMHLIARKPFRMLYAEDDEGVKNIVLSQMHAAVPGFEVTAVEDGTRLVEVADAEKGAYSLILTDHQMPGIDGVDATRWIRAFDAETPICVISGTGVRDEALQAGATDYINKNSTRTLELMANVRELARLYLQD